MDPIITAALIGGGVSALGGVFGRDSARETSYMNQVSADRQMAFQERMSNTQYQRGMSDMKAAGLNPMLAYSQGGAGGAPGASAANINPDYSDAASGIANSATGYINQKRERALLDSQVDLQAAQVKTALSQQKLNQASARSAEADARATETMLPALKTKSQFESRQNEINNKMLPYDAVMNRVGQVMGLGNSALSIKRFMQKPNIDTKRISTPPNAIRRNSDVGKTKGGTLYDKKTGEIYDR